MLKGEIVTSTVSDYTTDNILICVVLSKIFLMVEFFHNYLKTTIASKGTAFFDPLRVIKSFLTVVIIWFYFPLFSFVDFLLETINQFTAPDLSKMVEEAKVDNTKAFDTQRIIQLIEGKKATGSQEFSLWETLSSYSLKQLVFLVIDSIAMELCMIISTVVQIFSLVAHRILFCLGPFAFTFSILPYFDKTKLKWLGAYIQTLFIFTVLHVLNANVYDLMLKSLLVDEPFFIGVDIMEIVARIALNLSILGLYLSALYLTGIIIGSGDTIGQAFSNSMNAATNLVNTTALGRKINTLALRK